MNKTPDDKQPIFGTIGPVGMLVSSIGNQDAIKRFLRECQIDGGLNHPHIITVYDSGMTQLGPYLVMEHAAGET
jgi:serine/threonine protein kinase